MRDCGDCEPCSGPDAGEGCLTSVVVDASPTGASDAGGITPADAPTPADEMEMRVGVHDEAFRVDLHAFGFQPSPLLAGKLRVHLWARAGIRTYHPMPRQGRRFLVSESAHHKGHVPRRHIHVYRDGSIRREFPGRDQSDEADDFSADSGEGGGLGLRYELAIKLCLSIPSRKALSRLAMTVAGRTLFTYDLGKPPLNRVVLRSQSVRPIHPNHSP